MKHFVRPVLFVSLGAAALALAIGCRAEAAETLPQGPRVVVMCSVDQLATWVFEEALPHFGEGGFQRLLREGVTFPDCAYLHGCTETGPGHATIGTGAPANVHGIVHNEWYDVATKKEVYCANEPMAALAEFPEGKDRGPGRLLAPTLGDLLKQQKPAAKVVSVSAKDRAAILMAGGSADCVTWYEAATGRFVTNTRWGKTAPKWLVDLNQKPVADAYFGWQWTRSGSDAAYQGLVDEQAFEAPHPSSGGRTLPVTLRGKPDATAPSAEFYKELYVSPAMHELTMQVAKAAFVANEVGKDDVADLFCLSFSGTDTVGHYYGPESFEARDSLLRLDAVLAEFFTWLDAQVGKGNWTFALSADHGVGHSPQWLKERGQKGGRALLHTYAKAAAEKALRERFAGAQGEDKPAAPADAKTDAKTDAAKTEGAAESKFVVQAAEYALELNAEWIVAAAAKLGESDGKKALLEASRVAAQAVDKVPGMLRAFVTSDVLAQGLVEDPIQRAMFYAAHPDRAGHVLLVFEPGFIDSTYAATHGSPHEYDRRVPLLAMGPGLASGVSSKASASPGLLTVIAARALMVDKPKASLDSIPNEILRR